MNVINFNNSWRVGENSTADMADEGYLLWSALNMLEAQLCSLNFDDTLNWHNNQNNIFANLPLPKNLSELTAQLSNHDLAKLICKAREKGTPQTAKIADLGVIFKFDPISGLIAVQKYANVLRDTIDEAETLELKLALAENRIALFKQPIVCAKERSIIRFEGLARLMRHDATFALPHEFIPAAERTGLIKNLDIRALELAITEIKRDKDKHFATNASFSTIFDIGAREELINIIRKNPEIAPNITIEITETVAIHDFDIAHNFASEIRELGARLSIDDFGSGHTSFKSLRELPLDEVKIDGQYIKDIDKDGGWMSFVAPLVQFISEIGHDIIAERVETEAEAQALQNLPLRGLQGYLFGKPCP